MDAQRVGANVERRSVVACDWLMSGKRECLRQCLRSISQHCAGQTARTQRAIGFIRPIHKCFVEHAQTRIFARRRERGIRQPNQHQPLIKLRHRLGNRRSGGLIAGGEIVQRAVGFNMMQRRASPRRDCSQRRDLLADQRRDFGGTERHNNPPEIGAIRVARMCADLHAEPQRQFNGPPHRCGIARVSATRDVARRNQRQQRRIIAALLAHIRVQINWHWVCSLCVRGLPSPRLLRQPPLALCAGEGKNHESAPLPCGNGEGVGGMGQTRLPSPAHGRGVGGEGELLLLKLASLRCDVWQNVTYLIP